MLYACTFVLVKNPLCLPPAMSMAEVDSGHEDHIHEHHILC